MPEAKTTMGARLELAQCRNELSAARRQIATLEERIEHMQDQAVSRRKVAVKPQALRGTPIQGEMLYGTKAIAEFLGIRPRQALHLLEQDRLPHFHVGRVVCANRTTIKHWLAQMEANGGGR